MTTIYMDAEDYIGLCEMLTIEPQHIIENTMDYIIVDTIPPILMGVLNDEHIKYITS